MEWRGAILIDVSSGGTEKFDKDFLEKLGHPVLVCHGPGEEICPILREEGECELIDSAHGVLFEFDLDRPQHREILSKYQEMLAEDVPIRAVVKPGQIEKYSDILTGVKAWEIDPTVGMLDGFAAEVEAYDRLAE